MSDEEAAKEAGEWRKVLENYRRFMADDEERRAKRQEQRQEGTMEGRAEQRKARRAAPWARHRVSEARMLRCRVRYFTDGLVLGTKEFVDGAFCLTRERFGARRTSGARKLARAETELRTMRALRVDAYGSQ